MANPLRSLACTIAAMSLIAGGCTSRSSDSHARADQDERFGATSRSTRPSGELTIFAAASLTDAFNAIAEEFGTLYPDVDVKLNFAGSQSLRTQIEQGARPQVFASANRKHMDALRDAKLVDQPVMFVENELVIAVPAGNPAGIESLAELPKAKRLVLAGANVPAGAYAAKVLQNARAALGADFPERVMASVVSREMHVRQTLQKVVLGEADAAMVYATDATSAGDKVETIRIPSEFNVAAAYPIATGSESDQHRLGQLFIDFVQSDAGARLLEAHGFRPLRAVAKGAPATPSPTATR